MPAGIGYPNDKHLKKAQARGHFVPKTTSPAQRKKMADEAARLKERRKVDAFMAGQRGGQRPKQPPQSTKPLPGGQIGQAIRGASGLGRLTGVLTQKPKKKGRQ